DNDPEAMENSMYIRAKIVQNSWPFAQTAGALGYGNKIRKSQLDLDSVDNPYMLFIMRRGWVFLCLFLVIPVVVAIRSSIAFARAHLFAQRFPLIVAVAAVFGTMIAMYTVWFGFVYAILWMMMLAISQSM